MNDNRSPLVGGQDFQERLEQYARDLWPDDWREELLANVDETDDDGWIARTEDRLHDTPDRQGEPRLLSDSSGDWWRRISWWAAAAALLALAVAASLLLTTADRITDRRSEEPAATTSTTEPAPPVSVLGADPGIDGPSDLECGQIGVYRLRDLVGQFVWSVTRGGTAIEPADGTTDFDDDGGAVELRTRGSYKITASADGHLYTHEFTVGPAGDCSPTTE